MRVIYREEKGMWNYDHPLLITMDEMLEMGEKKVRENPDLFEKMIDETDRDDIAVFFYTSGTTGNPKGVRLPYRSYTTNRKTFESFLQIADTDRFSPVVCNPMHHTNSTAITDWALRRPGTQLHLLERYSSLYWAILVDIVSSGANRIVAPLVSRHFDYLENLRQALGDREPTVHVATARALTTEQQGLLARTFTALADRHVNLEVTVEPALAGGLRVRLGDMVVDNSIADRLEVLREGVSQSLVVTEERAGSE